MLFRFRSVDLKVVQAARRRKIVEITSILLFCLQSLSPTAFAKGVSAPACLEPIDQGSCLTFDPYFDVATIKPSRGEPPLLRPLIDGVHGRNVTVFDLMHFAFGAEYWGDRIEKAPGWALTDRYDVEARLSAEDTDVISSCSGDEQELMLRHAVTHLLAERFAMRIHHKQVDKVVYLLEVRKQSPNLILSTTHDTNFPTGRLSLTTEALIGTDISMSRLAAFLSNEKGCIVRDSTGLSGRYNFTVHWHKEDTSAADVQNTTNIDGAKDFERPSQPPFTSTEFVLHQLGLRMVRDHDSIDVIVIDNLARPTAN